MHEPILKRVGAVLVAVGLLDIGKGIYDVANGRAGKHGLSGRGGEDRAVLLDAKAVEYSLHARAISKFTQKKR